MTTTLPAGQFIGVMPVRYVGDLLELGPTATEQQVAPIYALSQRQCPHWPIISSLHDTALAVIGRKPKPIYQASYVIRQMGDHEFHTHLFRPLVQRRSLVRWALDGFRHPAKDPSRHLAVLVHKNTGEGHLIMGSKFEGALVERAGNNEETGCVNIFTRFVQSTGIPQVNLFGADFDPGTGQPLEGSILSLARLEVADKALATLNKILDNPKGVSHCQEVGILQAVGLAARAGYGCSANADQLLGHESRDQTACGSDPKMRVSTPQPLTIGRTAPSRPTTSARGFAINPVWALGQMFRGPEKGARS